MNKPKQRRIERVAQRAKNPIKNSIPPGLRQQIKAGTITPKKALEIVSKGLTPSPNFVRWVTNYAKH